jgi:hypothetical protein
MEPSWLTSYFHFLYAGIAVMAWLFVGLYATRKWYTSAAGWNYMLFQLSMAVLFTVLVTGGQGVWRLYVWAAGLTLVLLVVSHRVLLVAHDIWRDHHRDK